MTDVITVNRGSRMATLLRWSTKNIISQSQIKISNQIKSESPQKKLKVLTKRFDRGESSSRSLPNVFRA